MRLNLGSGPKVVPGWTSIDRSPTAVLQRLPGAKTLARWLGMPQAYWNIVWPRDVLLHDLSKGIPCPTGSVEAIYSSHTLEHMYADEAQELLLECHRCLRRGGVLRLALPDARAFAQELVADPENVSAAEAFNRNLNMHPPARPRGLARLSAFAGGSRHRWQATPALVDAMLQNAGFLDVHRRTYRIGDLPDLDVLEDRPESFFLEAIR